jgi:hypothetical protein
MLSPIAAQAASRHFSAHQSVIGARSAFAALPRPPAAHNCHVSVAGFARRGLDGPGATQRTGANWVAIKRKADEIPISHCHH